MYLYTAAGFKERDGPDDLAPGMVFGRVSCRGSAGGRAISAAAATASGTVSAGRPAAATGFALASAGDAADPRCLRTFGIRPDAGSARPAAMRPGDRKSTRLNSS